MAHVKTGVKLRICGTSANPGYEAKLRAFVKEKRLENRSRSSSAGSRRSARQS